MNYSLIARRESLSKTTTASLLLRAEKSQSKSQTGAGAQALAGKKESFRRNPARPADSPLALPQEGELGADKRLFRWQGEKAII